jgi:hypothetical protein
MSGAVGALSVFIGAISYGMSGVILSLATASGAKIESLIPTQFLFSFVLFSVLSELKRNKAGAFHTRDKLLVLATGIPILYITYCFYNAVYYDFNAARNAVRLDGAGAECAHKQKAVKAPGARRLRLYHGGRCNLNGRFSRKIRI